MEGIVLWPEPIGSELHLPAEPSAPSQVTLDGKGDPVGLMPQAVAPRTVRTACRMRFGELLAVVKNFSVGSLDKDIPPRVLHLVEIR
jgi:hypothetical protein